MAINNFFVMPIESMQILCKLFVQVSAMFGGLALCSLEAVVAKDGKEYIIEVNDCAMGLLGESQEDDRRNIAEVVIKEMEVIKTLL